MFHSTFPSESNFINKHPFVLFEAFSSNPSCEYTFEEYTYEEKKTESFSPISIDVFFIVFINVILSTITYFNNVPYLSNFIKNVFGDPDIFIVVVLFIIIGFDPSVIPDTYILSFESKHTFSIETLPVPHFILVI